ncbi:hypothetical protein GQ53DRAFT_836683 [Thozetella sp. PMI_491]|nr:hypothetical protein GQ53DRAFT_836683 [Thozetella sp. PMI_491]
MAIHPIHPIKDTRGFVFVTSPRAITTEYAPAFYNASTFRITEPEHGLAFIRSMRPDNLAHVRRLSIFVEAFYATVPPRLEQHSLPFWVPRPNAPAWYALLDAVRDRLPGLCELEIYLHAELTGFHQDIPRLGAGNDPEFARRLAGLRGLEKLELDGFFPREWPAYLERELGLSTSDDGAVKLGGSVWAPEGRTDSYLKLLRRYQGYCPPLEL